MSCSEGAVSAQAAATVCASRSAMSAIAARNVAASGGLGENRLIEFNTFQKRCPNFRGRTTSGNQT
jgi:hypothetical protein